MLRDMLKTPLSRVGLLTPARHLYRRLDSKTRRERALFGRFYSSLIEPGALCFDIGANVGQTTEALLDCGSRVVAVEPNPRCVPALRWQFSRNPRVTLLRKAVGAEPGTATLNFTGTDPRSSIRNDWSPSSNDATAEVAVTTLDELIEEYGRPNLCKVDVEGFEPEVFRGLSQPIPLIYFEVHEREIDQARGILSRLSSLGPITSVNLTTMDNEAWLFDEWLSVEEFSERLAEKLDGIGNIVVRMAVT